MQNEEKILILGGSSYVGRSLSAELGYARTICTYNSTNVKNGIFFNSLTMDLADVVSNPEGISHAVILLGDTNPETCAADVQKSYALNVDSIKLIIKRLSEWHIKPIFASSEFVFDGTKGNYVETDPVNPILTYGRQKVEIEKYLQDYCENHVIIRLAKVFGDRLGDDTLFTKWIDDIAKNRTIRCAYDQSFSPIYVRDVVRVVIQLTEANCDGIFHLASTHAYSRVELLEILLKHVNKYVDIDVGIVRCSILDFDLLEKRPLNVSMVPDKLIQTMDFQVSDIESTCKDIVSDIFENGFDRLIDKPIETQNERK